MHLVLLNAKLMTIYNPGMITGLFGIGTVVIVYLATAFDPEMYAWYDYLLGFVYFAIAFWLCFRSPLYWKIGAAPGYPMTDRSAYGLEMAKLG